MVKVVLMTQVENIDYAMRLRVLTDDLRQVRRAVDRVGAADVVHTLNNAVLTVHGALGLVEARLAQGRNDDVAGLLEMAERRLRECRALVVRRRRPGLVRMLDISSLA